MPDTAAPGQLLMQGMTNLGQGLGQAAANYKTIRLQDQIASGQLDAMLQQQGMGALQQLSPNGQKLAQKYLEGKANLNDKLQLLGEQNTSMAVQKKQADVQQAQAQAAYQQANARMLNARLQAMQGLGQAQAPGTGALQMVAPGMGTPTGTMGGTGAQQQQDPPSTVTQPPKVITLADPEAQSIYRNALQQTFGDADAASARAQKVLDSINDRNKAVYDQAAAKETPTGNFYRAGYDTKDGLIVNDQYVPEIIKGKGTASEAYAEGTKILSIPHNSQPPGPVVARGGRAQPDQGSPTEYNVNDPQVQQEIQNAYETAGQSSLQLSKAKLYLDAVNAYTSGDSGKWNAIRGNPTYAGVMQMLKGTNPLDALRIAMAANTGTIIDQVRSPQNGSIGGRMLQTEYENTADLLGKGTMSTSALRAAAQNIYNIADRRNSIDHAYAVFRESMPAGQAEAKAINMFGDSPSLTINPPVGSPAGQPSMPPAPGQQPNQGIVRMRNPQGQLFAVPSAKAAAAAAAGWSPAQ